MALTAFSVVAALAKGPVVPAASLAVSLILAILARLPARAVAGRLLGVNAFVVFLWIVLPFSLPGQTVFSLGPLEATRQGLALALLVTIKSNAVFLAFLALAATSDAAALGQGAARLGAPDKLVFLFLFTYRFVNLIAEEYGRLVTAARLRAFRPRTDRRTYLALASLLAMILSRSMDRADRTRQAMDLRCFSGRFATLRTFAMGRGEWLLVTVMLGLSLAMAVLELTHGR